MIIVIRSREALEQTEACTEGDRCLISIENTYYMESTESGTAYIGMCVCVGFEYFRRDAEYFKNKNTPQGKYN